MLTWLRLFTIAQVLFLSPDLLASYSEEAKRIDFEVRDSKTKELYLTVYELSTVTPETARREAWYYDTKKTEVQYENVLYRRDNLRVENYQFKNSVTGEATDSWTEGETMRVKYRPALDKALQTGSIEWTKDSYHGKVFNNMILRNWSSLRAGNPIKFQLILPFRFESLGFQIAYKKTAQIAGDERVIFALEPTSFFIRAIAPRMEFHYIESDRPRIRQFTGPSSMPLKGEKDRLVDIIFSYPKA
jgi:hypothetical protein